MNRKSFIGALLGIVVAPYVPASAREKEFASVEELASRLREMRPLPTDFETYKEAREALIRRKSNGK